MKRILEAEWLDTLPPNHRDAIASRRDLRRVNWLMGNARIMERFLTKAAPDQPIECLTELGGGDGAFLLGLTRRLSLQGQTGHAVLVDRQESVSDEVRRGFKQIGWSLETVTADVFDWLSGGRQPVNGLLLANLFLHHFPQGELERLLGLIAECSRLFVACEPRRCSLTLRAVRFLGLLGCNAVTRHDGLVSVRAGFAGCELSDAWPGGGGWNLREGRAGLFSHYLVGQRSRSLTSGANQTIL